MCALSLNTQAKLDKQILRDKHDAILNAFVLDMKRMLIDKEFVEYNNEYCNKHLIVHAPANAINEVLYKIDVSIHDTSLNVNEHFDNCALLVKQLSEILIELVINLKTCINYERERK